ncbi:LuxR C-terminal-related transcriptional regulator [Terriglobus roseus]|uniref:Two component transcriptional regulator, LuxR family n=1 Tax=Terriglobus roseus TaxID=392734 RepID=A0A1G7NQ25_9BACT|nr:response regulator transcription factor [Terriglobus roseus]SDF76144.1 two component transcriptional regulator, LuxR family [Terriglobus roseus]
MNPISRVVRIVLIDDHVLFREGLRSVLEGNDAFSIVGTASTLPDALELCAKGPSFDLALIDYQLHTDDNTANGLEVLRTLRASRPEANAIVLTGGLPTDTLLEILKQHRAGVFLKTEPVSELLIAIEKTLRGEVAISAKAAEALLQATELGNTAAAPASFSERDLLVLRLITEGLANKEIAIHLNTSESNVKAILQRLFEKTGVRSRSQLVRYVFEFNLELS